MALAGYDEQAIFGKGVNPDRLKELAREIPVKMDAILSVGPLTDEPKMMLRNVLSHLAQANRIMDLIGNNKL